MGKWKKRSKEVREAALNLYLKGASDYENASRNGVSIYTIEAWKRLHRWREVRSTHRLTIKGGIPGVLEVGYERKWTSRGGGRRTAPTESGASETPNSELKTRSGRRRGKKKWEPEARKKLTHGQRRKLGAVLLSEAEAARPVPVTGDDDDVVFGSPFSSTAIISGPDGKSQIPLPDEDERYTADERPTRTSDPFSSILPPGSARRRLQPVRGLALDGFPERLKRKKKAG